ncbi:hypothetical protein Aduo_019199 [Ancylostoma duodenale]
MFEVKATYCLDHFNHENDTAFLKLAEKGMNVVAALMRDGLIHGAIKKTTACDDLTSVTMHIERDSPHDGIRSYTAAKEGNGDGFMLVIIKPMQSRWLRDFAERGISIDDTFDVSQ